MGSLRSSRAILFLLVFQLSGASALAQNTLYVDASTGSDARTYAQAQNPLTPWETIERAAWGSNNRSSPDASIAAQDGDTVWIVGTAAVAGACPSSTLYTTTAVVNSTLNLVYNSANDGITYRAQGCVALGAPNANAPLLGGDDKWIADRADSRFIVVADGRLGTIFNISSSEVIAGDDLRIHLASDHGYTTGDTVIIRNHNATGTPSTAQTGSNGDLSWTITVVDSDSFDVAGTFTAGGTNVGTVRERYDEKGDTGVVNTDPDTGPILLTGTGGQVEGFDIDGGELIDYRDNWNGVRTQQATDCIVRRNYIHDFRAAWTDGAENTDHNKTAITLYSSIDCLVEHNLFENNGSAVFFKDNDVHPETHGNIIRYNRILAPDLPMSINPEGVTWSLGDRSHAANYIYQNVITDVDFGIRLSGGEGDQIFNNTFARVPFGVYLNALNVTHDVLFWNNVVRATTNAITADQTFPATTKIDFEHNVYHGYSAFGDDPTGGTYTLAQWQMLFGQDDVAPDSLNADPLFTDADADDFTLQALSPALSLGVDSLDLDGDMNTSENIDAGAYPGQVPEACVGLCVEDEGGGTSGRRPRVRIGTRVHFEQPRTPVAAMVH